MLELSGAHSSHGVAHGVYVGRGLAVSSLQGVEHAVHFVNGDVLRLRWQ
jgi:hypothetical protein